MLQVQSKPRPPRVVSLLRTHLNSEGQQELLAYIQELADDKTVQAAEKLLESRDKTDDSTVDAANDLADEAVFLKRMVDKLREFSSPECTFECCKVVSVHDTTPAEEK